jgi:hypothetical protein
MDFDQLEIFLEVARLASFSRAAGKRFRSQPAVSSQIRALEEEVGARLLDRSGVWSPPWTLSPGRLASAKPKHPLKTARPRVGWIPWHWIRTSSS